MMNAKQCRPKRGKEILQLVRDHGPVTIDMIYRMLKATMTKRNIRKALRVLRDKKLIDVIQADAQTAFYQISQGLRSRKEAADMIGNCSEEEMIRPLLRRQDLFHNQWCEYWALSMKRIFPEIEIVREHSVGSYEIAKRVLQVKDGEFDLLPDFLALFPSVGSHDPIYVAFEIERTRKSDARIIRKLNRYLNSTKIDGLIYICDNGRLSETIRQLYRSKLQAQSQRVKHYGNNFFLFTDAINGGGPELNRFVNANADPVSLPDWCEHLRSTKWTKRRDTEFQQMGGLPFDNSNALSTAH